MKLFNKMTKMIIASALSVAMLLATAVPAFASTTKHKVTFLYGTKKYVTTVADGCDVLPPTDTYVPGYVFAGWVGNSVNVRQDLTILGSYIPVPTKPLPALTPVPQTPQAKDYVFTVRFVDGLTGAEFNVQKVGLYQNAYGPSVPHHDGYHFSHFEGSFLNVDSSRTITAIYDRDYNDIDWRADYERTQAIVKIVDQADPELIKSGIINENTSPEDALNIIILDSILKQQAGQ